MEGKKGIGRRDLVKTTAVGVATLAGLSSKESQAKGPARKWDKEADVVVVGFGGAGAVAAISAHDKGAKVLLLEKAPENAHYPNTAMAGGNSHYAKDPEDAEAYFKAAAFGVGLPPGFGDAPEVYPNYPKGLADDIAKVWGKEVCQTADWMKKLDPSFEYEVSIPTKDFPSFPGGKQYGHFLTVPKNGVVEKTGGQTFFKYLTDAVKKRKVEILWETPGKKLIHDGQGEVYGVIASRKGKDMAIKARRAVILASGGFENDQELKHAFLPGWKWVFIGNPLNTGDGVRMAMHAGAMLGHMHHNAARVVCGAMFEEIGTGFQAPCNRPAMMLVDNYGRRFANEDHMETSPQRYQFYNLVIHLDPTKLEYPRIPSWMIFDEKARKKEPIVRTFFGAHAVGLYKWSNDNTAEIEKGWILKADTIDDLAGKIAKQPDGHGRMDAGALKENIDKFNHACKEEKDSEFGRKRGLVSIDTPPFYATAMYPGGPNTEGGPVRNAKAQVIDTQGKPIRRLYINGELGSVWSFAYQCGGNIAESIIFGRIAGVNAAAEKPW